MPISPLEGCSDRRKRLCGECEDRISKLPDELLLTILEQLDTRTAMATSVLSTRWRHLPRLLTSFNFAVTDVLNRNYSSLLWRRDHIGDVETSLRLKRYERSAMRSYVKSVDAFLHSSNDLQVKKLSLEFFAMENSTRSNQWIKAAIASLRVKDLEVAIKPRANQKRFTQPFPSRWLKHTLDGCLNSLALRNFKPRNLDACPGVFSSLAKLSLHDIEVKREVYTKIFTVCAQLEVLHLKSCKCQPDAFFVDVQRSRVKELVIDGCGFSRIKLVSAPKLERLACQGSPMPLCFGCVPCLSQVNLNFSIRQKDDIDNQKNYELGYFLKNAPALEELIVRFWGRRRWLTPVRLATPLAKLKRLLIVDVPFSWDLSWTRLLLEDAPLLETFHIHLGSLEGLHSPPIQWEPSRFQHNHLKSLAVIRFVGVEKDISFVRYVMGVSRALETVVLIVGGHVRQNGLWNWEIVRPRDHPGKYKTMLQQLRADMWLPEQEASRPDIWLPKQKAWTLEQLRADNSSSAQIILEWE